MNKESMYNDIFNRPNFSTNRSSGGRVTGYTDMSPWQYHVDHHQELSKYKQDMAQYHQQKMQYYQQMARVSPWGWWYKMKAMHHRDLVKRHQREHQLHQAKRLKYLMKIDKNTLRDIRTRLK